MKWGDFEADAGVLGDEARRLLEGPGLGLVATIRRDRSPRVSPVEPFFWDGELWLGMMWRSRKAADLHRDPGVLVHSVVTTPDAPEPEVKIRGAAIPEADVDRRSDVCRALGDALPWQPDPNRIELFRVDVESAALVRYAETGDQHVMLWPARRRFVRRATSATSVGAPEGERSF